MFVSTVVVRAIVAEVENRGLRAERVLLAAGLERATLAEPVEGVRYREFDRLVRQAIELTGDPALGLAVGTRSPETMLHVVGMLLVTSTTIREAFTHMRRFGSLVTAGVDWQLAERDELASFGFACGAPTLDVGADTARFFTDCALSLALRIGRHFAPLEPPVELRLTHAQPSYAATYGPIFGCPVRFGQPANELVFRRALLDRSQPHADPLLSSMLADMAEKLQHQASGTSCFAERVRMALRYESELANFDFDSLAARWGITRRVLRRRLSSEGWSLSELLDEARCARAVEELGRPESKIKHVAEELGYSETSAFHRAFKRWTGRTPSDYKAELRAQPAATSSERAVAANAG